MKITEICIKRPVLATVLSLSLIILGAVSYVRLQVRHYPRIDQPKISVTTRFEGASPDIVETQVTKPLEDALQGIEGLEELRSKSELEQSTVYMTFTMDRNIDGAANDVRDRIARARGSGRFPQDVQNPQIRKADADAVPVMTLVLYSDRHELKDVADYANNTLESQLSVVSGVANVDIWGGGMYQMHIRLDPKKMAQFKLNASDVSEALRRQNIEKPAGHLITEDKEISVTTKAPLRTELQYRQAVIAERNGSLIRVGDVADVSFDAVENAFKVRYNGHDTVSLSITKQSVANPLTIAQGVKDLLPSLRRTLPEGMVLDIAKDDSIFIEKSIDEVKKTILEASVLVILVLFIFLRSLRASIIPIVTIPLSLIGTFALMYWFGFTINILTLLALVMAIGLVVDDAIVILENIYRHIEKGMKPLEAAFQGSREIAFAVIAMTITLAAVYAPIALSKGTTGKIFTEFALTLAGAVILSGFIALTLSPMMCSRLLRHKNPKTAKKITKANILEQWISRLDTGIDHSLIAIDNFYGRTLTNALQGVKKLSLGNLPPLKRFKWHFSRRIYVMLLAAITSLSGLGIGLNMKRDLSPSEDQGFVRARAFPPQGASLEYISRFMNQAEKIIEREKAIERRLTTIQARGDTTMENFLVPWEQRDSSSQEIAQRLFPRLDQKITGLSFNMTGRGRSLIGSGGRGRPVELLIQSPKSYEELNRIFEDFVRDLRTIKGIDQRNIEDTRASDEQVYIVHIDRDKAAQVGVDPASVAEMLDTLISGRPATHMKYESRRYPVTVELEEQYRKTKEDIMALSIRAQRGQKKESMIPLSEIVSIEKQMIPTRIDHTSGLRSITLEAELIPGAGLGEVLEAIRDIPLPEGARLEFAGESKRFFEESSNILFIFGLAVISIYLVLSAQYESFIDPLIILFSVPLSLAGGVIFLALLGGKLYPFEAGALTIFGQIGLVTLIGLITKHGILIVDFANTLLEEGKDRTTAVLEASKLRLRPILMTTLAMVLGAIPLALATGAGSESRQQIGWVIVGGMSVGTVFTLYVIPVVYTFISRENLGRAGLWVVGARKGYLSRRNRLNKP